MGKGSDHVPIRTCVSCGAKRDKAQLHRLVLEAGGQLVRDDFGRGQGRGAYVCKSKACLGQLAGNRRLERALHAKKAPLIASSFWPEE
jgi:predicted RNA-binding protein YlxR (DUF448 family)